MSYRVRFTTQTGATFYWERTFATRTGATHSAQLQADSTGYTFAVEEVHEPGSTAAHHVDILRARVKELEAELAEAKASLAKAPSVPVGASEAPGEGGDSDRRRLEALERWLKGGTYRLVYFSIRQLIVATSDSMMDEATAPTIAALADKLMEKEAKP